jgi:hypothetical protein
MIIWLASYPRSGNTMLRSMMQQAFGLKSFSMYDDLGDIGSRTDISDGTGHEFLGCSFEEFYAQRRHSPELNLVKTHQPPLDDGKAIYIVRDARSSIISWHNMLVRLRKRTDVSVADLIRGEKVKWGDWTSHVRAWAPLHRQRTLLLKYADLVARPDEMLQRVSTFIDQPLIGVWKNNFDQLHQLFPEFFNQASDEKNLAQMTAEDEKLFWTLHGDCMRELGFGESPPPGPCDLVIGPAVPQNVSRTPTA